VAITVSLLRHASHGCINKQPLEDGWGET